MSQRDQGCRHGANQVVQNPIARQRLPDGLREQPNLTIERRHRKRRPLQCEPFPGLPDLLQDDPPRTSILTGSEPNLPGQTVDTGQPTLSRAQRNARLLRHQWTLRPG